ncbi:unnamed protein product [Heligmosomoides polygyrus]|uniref:Reverse transcriptase domain-containing protein n=1 Tax=Heligmosomoides polygyrus TaxID=6339 RepID=A0A183GCX1_HELPZ|nr:unnamed protein product [Heligmosomoides polygyrus]
MRQPCEQTGFRIGFRTIIHTIAKLIEMSRKPLCLAFIDLKNALDSVETDAVFEALLTHGVPTQYISPSRAVQKIHDQDLTILQRRLRMGGVQQGDTISPKLFNATLEKVMLELEWEDMGVKVDDRQLHQICFAGDIVLITPSINISVVCSLSSSAQPC